MLMRGIEAVTLDFFNTLVRHNRGDGGRGAQVMEYLRARGLESDPWDHQILYDVFEPHGREYSPAFGPIERQRYLVRLAGRLFQALNVRGGVAAADHAASIWELIGPHSLEVFPDVRITLEHLRAAGLRLAVVSNWQCGLGHFCEELGLRLFFDEVIASAETGCAKPQREIFLGACRRLDVAPDRVLHVGDTPEDDLDGARNAGLHALLIRRDALDSPADWWIRSLEQLPARLEIPSVAHGTSR
jgi:HAD superfamily hydrolase (TIGR01509 family)